MTKVVTACVLPQVSDIKAETVLLMYDVAMDREGKLGACAYIYMMHTQLPNHTRTRDLFIMLSKPQMRFELSSCA